MKSNIRLYDCVFVNLIKSYSLCIWLCFIPSLVVSAHGSHRTTNYHFHVFRQKRAGVSETDYPPKFREAFSSQTLDPGPPLSLKCIAGGIPIPQITWQLDDSPIPESFRVRFGDYVTKDGLVISYVNISTVRVEDGGSYSCKADNGLATIEHSAKINVLGPPVVRPMRNITVVGTEPLIVRCPVAGYPLDTITWERAGHRLPYNHRQKVHDNGTLEVYHIERATDEGLYTCIAKNKKGQTAQSTVYVRVQIKPVIEPFTFPTSLREGQRASVLCTVSSGDMPITLQWFKDDVPISQQKGVRVNEVADYSSTLLFESLALDHKGNYTCIASNTAGTVSHTASMIIHVPPRWTVEPNDASVVRGRSITIDCSTQGYPYPRIIWTKSSSSQTPRDFKPIISGPHLQVCENGSLSIQEARDADQGFYLCQAQNGIGQGLSKVVKISVHVAAHFKSKFTAEMVRKGHNIKLKCEAFGDKPIAITWTRDKQKIDVISNTDTIGSTSTDSRYELSETINTKSIVSEVLIKRADRRDSSLFTCLASNSFGYDDTNIQLIVQEPPDPPKDLQVLEITSRSIKISWSPPYSGNSPIVTYYMQYRSGGQGSDPLEWMSALNVSFPSGETIGQIVGLRPAVLYFFRLIAENHIGKSESSRPIEAMTEEESPGGPPINIKVRAISSRSISVTWDQPKREQQNGLIRGYYIGYKMFGTSSQYVYKTLQIRDGNREEVILNGLKQNTQYSIVVQAFNTKGAGPSSEELKVQTLEMDAPTSPQIQVTSSSGSSIHLAWDPVVDDDNPIDGYLIFQREDSSTEWKEFRIVGQQSFYTAIDLKCGTRYQFYLVAYNRIGRGEPSDIVTVKTDGSVPVAPDKLSVVTVNRSSALIHLDSWHHGGCPINKFKIFYRLLTNAEWIEIHHNLNEKQIEINGLVVGTRYQLRITANNEVGYTEAEYTFTTQTDSHELNPRTASGHTIRGTSNKHSTNNLNEYSLVIPVAITLLVIVILLAIVVLVLRKSSANGSIYSRKQDSLQMSHMDSCKSGRSTYTNSPYNTPHNCSNGTETAPKINSDFASRMIDEPLYATVKRTPRAPRSEAHIYSYPIQTGVSEMPNMQISNCANGPNCANGVNCANSSQTIPQTATLIVTVDDRDLEEKLLDELQQQCPLNEHRLSLTHCR